MSSIGQEIKKLEAAKKSLAISQNAVSTALLAAKRKKPAKVGGTKPKTAPKRKPTSTKRRSTK